MGRLRTHNNRRRARERWAAWKPYPAKGTRIGWTKRDCLVLDDPIELTREQRERLAESFFASVESMILGPISSQMRAIDFGRRPSFTAMRPFKDSL